MEYITVGQETCAEFTEKRSRFIGYIKPVSSEEEAIAFIESKKTKHWDATHNVYAYSLRAGNTCRYSDDGEPSGTAGMPVLSVLTKGGITDAVVVVTRYFGGILLGGGGLVRAYSHSAALAVEAAGLVTMRQCLLCSLSCDYGQYGRVGSLVPDCGGVIDSSEFTDVVSLKFHITQEQLERMKPLLADATCGSCSVSVFGSDFFEFKAE